MWVSKFSLNTLWSIFWLTWSGADALSFSPFSALSTSVPVMGRTTLQQRLRSGSWSCRSVLNVHFLLNVHREMGFSLAQSPLSTDLAHHDRLTEYSFCSREYWSRRWRLLGRWFFLAGTSVAGFRFASPATQSTRLATVTPLIRLSLSFTSTSARLPLLFSKHLGMPAEILLIHKSLRGCTISPNTVSCITVVQYLWAECLKTIFRNVQLLKIVYACIPQQKSCFIVSVNRLAQNGWVKKNGEKQRHPNCYPPSVLVIVTLLIVINVDGEALTISWSVRGYITVSESESSDTGRLSLKPRSVLRNLSGRSRYAELHLWPLIASSVRLGTHLTKSWCYLHLKP